MTNTSMPLTQSEVFSRVPKSEAITYSTFDRSHRHLTAIDASYLYPLYIDEVYPGDVFELNGRHLNRLLASVKPFMDNLKFKMFYFYVPTRLVWNNFKRFMGERRRDTESISDVYQVPMLNSGANGVSVGSIFDYAGIPVGVPNLSFSALPFRAMNYCYDEYFRDENLSSWLNVGGVDVSGTFDVDSEFGDSDQLKNYSLFKISKAHDYFCSALPFQQYGLAQSISIGTSAPVKVLADNKPIVLYDGTSSFTLGSAQSGTSAYLTQLNSNLYHQPIGTTGTPIVSSSGPKSLAFNPGLMSKVFYADLANATGFTISDLRTSMQLQALKELTARMGHRYKEIIYGEFNVMVSDATLDRPEFLGSYTEYFNVIPVASTAETTDNPQGTLSAFSYTSNNTHFGFAKGFEEHGYVIGFATVVTDQSYQQGLNRMWSRKNKYDFYTPLLADISEQAVKMKEILAQGASVLQADGVTPVDEKTFGYQEAWAELRYKPNMVTGKMRSTASGTLDVWHLATKFTPTVDSSTSENLGVPLNQDFIEDNTNVNLQRVLAVTGEPQIESDNYFDLKCSRELPIYSVPAYLRGRL